MNLSKKYGNTTRIKPGFSPGLLIALCMLHLFGMVSVLLILHATAYLSLLLLPLIVISLINSLKRNIFMTSCSSISAFMNTPSRGWMVVIGDKEYPAELIPGSYVSKLFHLLRFRLDETRRTAAVIVACDAIDEDAYRRLAVKLRVSAKEVVHAD